MLHVSYAGSYETQLSTLQQSVFGVRKKDSESGLYFYVEIGPSKPPGKKPTASTLIQQYWQTTQHGRYNSQYRLGGGGGGGGGKG